jgi:hypothetical protein
MDHKPKTSKPRGHQSGTPLHQKHKNPIAVSHIFRRVYRAAMGNQFAGFVIR